MKRNVILLLLSLLTTTVSFSQTTYPIIRNDSTVVITKEQLKQANLVFLERDKLFQENLKLDTLVSNYELMVSNLEQSDSIKSKQINTLTLGLKDADAEIRSNYAQINKLTSKNKMYKGLTIGGFTVSIALLVLLLVK